DRVEAFHARQQARLGLAKPVDRLLEVADAEEAARARAVGQDLLGERREDAPLHGRRVLELVEQEMVEAPVEAVPDLLADAHAALVARVQGLRQVLEAVSAFLGLELVEALLEALEPVQ